MLSGRATVLSLLENYRSRSIEYLGGNLLPPMRGVIAITDPGDPNTLQSPESFPDGLQVCQGLGGMFPIRQAVDHGHGRGLRELFEGSRAKTPSP